MRDPWTRQQAEHHPGDPELHPTLHPAPYAGSNGDPIVLASMPYIENENEITEHPLDLPV